MIKPVCYFCKQELEDFGAILLSPPNKEGMVEKRHVCRLCYENLDVDWNGMAITKKQ